MDFQKHQWDIDKDKLTGGNYPLPKLTLFDNGKKPDKFEVTSTPTYLPGTVILEKGAHDKLNKNIDPQTNKYISDADIAKKYRWVRAANGELVIDPKLVGADVVTVPDPRDYSDNNLQIMENYAMADPEMANLYLKWKGGIKDLGKDYGVSFKVFKNPLSKEEAEQLFGYLNDKIDKADNIANTWYSEYGTKSQQQQENLQIFGSPSGALKTNDSKNTLNGDYKYMKFMRLSAGDQQYEVIDGENLPNGNMQIMGTLSPFEGYTAKARMKNPQTAVNFSNGRIVSIDGDMYAMTAPVYDNTGMSQFYNNIVTDAMLQPGGAVPSYYYDNKQEKHPILVTYNPDNGQGIPEVTIKDGLRTGFYFGNNAEIYKGPINNVTDWDDKLSKYFNK